MKVNLPAYLGGYSVEIDVDRIKPTEMLIGWVNEYGTITSSHANVVIGDLCSIKDHEIMALVINVDEFKKHLGLGDANA